MLDLSKLDGETTEILAAMAQLGPLVQTAVDELKQIKTGDTRAQAAVDVQAAKLAPVAVALEVFGTALRAAREAQAAAAAPPAPGPVLVPSETSGKITPAVEL